MKKVTIKRGTRMCKYCKGVIKIGEDAYLKMRGSRPMKHKREYYCVKCYDKVTI